MIICPDCLTVNKNKAVVCSKCGISIENIPEKVNQENLWRYRMKHRLRSHMLTGFILCFGIPTILNLISLTLTPYAIFLNLIFGVIFGVPLGNLVSRFAENIWSGMAIGLVIGILYYLLFWLIQGGQFDIASAFIGITVCIFPGAIMGYHVGMDD